LFQVAVEVMEELELLHIFKLQMVGLAVEDKLGLVELEFLV
jgi:hypothetical protein